MFRRPVHDDEAMAATDAGVHRDFRLAEDGILASRRNRLTKRQAAAQNSTPMIDADQRHHRSAQEQSEGGSS